MASEKSPTPSFLAIDKKQVEDDRDDQTLVENLFEEGSVDPVYEAKALLLNRAVQEIGMGKYQWHLFVVAGFGWFADSVWPLLSGLILAPVVNEFQFQGPFLSLAINVGLFVGAVFWSLGCDIWGRRWSFNLTLLITGIFGLSSGGAPNLVTLASLLATLGIGVGGNMPVDSAVFLDFIPGSSQYLLTVMSIWWSIGQLFVNLIAWPLIANFSCSPTAPPGTCTRSENMGWRYLLFTLGGVTLLLWALRFFLFNLEESPRYLVGLGRDEEAIGVLQRVAAYNGSTCSLTVDQLVKAGEEALQKAGVDRDETKPRHVFSKSTNYSVDHIKALFKTRKMAFSTTLLIALWGIIGLASTLYNNFLPYLLASRGAQFGDSSYYITYRNQVILSVLGVPGAFLAGWAVEQPNSNSLLGWNCAYAFVSNIMYGVLYAVSPEVFPAKDRGTGNGLTATATRVFGILAPVIALYANLETAVPVYVSGALIIGSGILSIFLPYEPRGKASL
ncbi:MFS sugar transporter [Steccherinum ochraceum]|uniref:MFS sugar transporter n=1 Tax=Steccherinum ochraceum TaxID=92696 RepID=A0A4R0RC25_9APHY|nr:MFS sugar transporter [Steccherinum ochraceum]